MSPRPRLRIIECRLFFALTSALLATGAILGPAPAGARPPGHYLLRTRRAIRFRVHGSHGYVIGVADSRGHFVATTRRGTATTEYELRSVRLRPAPGLRVRGMLGELGSFDIRFTARGRPRQLSPFSLCAGPGPTIQPGAVRGEIRFRGERGYTSAVARHASAELETMPGQRCRYGETGRGKHPPRFTATLSADHEPEKGPESHFEGLHFAPGSRPPARRAFYEAADYERVGSVLITRKIRLAAKVSTFLLPSFAVTPDEAVIQPPAPFMGSATFAPTSESTYSWTGDLAVSFPGIDPVALAGPDFRLHYCDFRGCVSQRSPEEYEEPPN